MQKIMLTNGIIFNHQVMPNGEKRYRLYHPDGSGYIRTESLCKGIWQNSHYHSSTCEVYIVQKGWIVFAELTIESKHKIPKFTLISKNGVCFSRLGIPHNVFLSENSVIHTVKYGEASEKDWIASEELDNLTKHLSEEEVLKMSKKLGDHNGAGA